MTISHRSPTRIALLGSTGSIGRQTLDVALRHPDRFEIVGLAAGRDHQRLNEQIAAAQPRMVALADDAGRRHLDLPASATLLDQPDALDILAAHEEVDMVVVGTGGIVSLRPVITALDAGKIVATANKETLVAGGHLVMPLAARRAAEAAASDATSPLASPLAWLRPIDSEHSAIWQCLSGERMAQVHRLMLTASGGPFRGRSAADLARATAADALAHPTWTMGAKITIDSATLMNKGLEVIEAHWLYDVPYHQIEVLVHPQSIIHSLVEFVDGSLKAQLGLPDMRIPIQYALTYPERISGAPERLDLLEHRQLTFEAPDDERFPALRIARDAGLRGPRATAALIAADEVAVARFLDGRLDFPGISRLVEGAVDAFGDAPAGSHADPSLEQLLELDQQVRAWAEEA